MNILSVLLLISISIVIPFSENSATEIMQSVSNATLSLISVAGSSGDP